MIRPDQQALINGAQEIDQSLSLTESNSLMAYLKLLLKWNKTYNLTAITDPIEAVEKHLLDCLKVLPHIGDEPLLDIGSGAGLPGIVIAIIRPDLEVSTLDSAGKKCRFMRFAASQLRLENLTVIHSKVEDFQPSVCFSQIISRAFADTEKTFQLSADLLCDNGKFLLMKGVNFERENPPKSTIIHQLKTPDNSPDRYLLEIPKPL